MTPPVACVAPTGDRCGEGAVWSAEERAVYWTDVLRFLVHRHDLDSGAVRSWFFEQPVVALSLTTRPGTLLVALGARLLLWRPETDARAEHGFVLSGYPRVRLNDGRADRLGNFWVGSMKNNVGPNGEAGEAGPGEGVLFRVAPDGSVREAAHGVGIANTLCWSPDGQRFYFGDTLANEVRVHDHDPVTGDVSNPRPFLSGHPRGLPDGSAMDAEGALWNCRFGGGGGPGGGGGGARGRGPPDGRTVREIEMPVANPTTCTFGGADLKTLFVTTAACPARLAGSLFALATEAPGQAESRFRVA